VAGPLIVPVKIRLKPFDFTSDVSFGAAIGVVGRFSRVVESNKYTFLLTTGVSSVTVDSATTKGEYESSQDLPAFYVAAGAVISLRNNFTLGFFGGIDLLSNNSVENWAYQGKPWIGVGLGITMFNLSGVQKKTVNPKQL